MKKDFKHDEFFVSSLESKREEIEKTGVELQFRCNANIARLFNGKKAVGFYQLLNGEIIYSKTLKKAEQQ